MWRDVGELKQISESIAGKTNDGYFQGVPYYVRRNPLSDSKAELEYTKELPPKSAYPKELLQTAAGKIKLVDRGEFGGYLSIGGKQVRSGNFSEIFKLHGEKYVIDSLGHLMVSSFRLIRIKESGKTEVIYDAGRAEMLRWRKHPSGVSGARGESVLSDEMDITDESDIPKGDVEDWIKQMDYQIGLNAYHVGTWGGQPGLEAAYFLCGGLVIDREKEGEWKSLIGRRKRINEFTVFSDTE